ncbi:MAG TPA: response regulator [Ohtaekwangia sp.]|nr:response regulator [Ohtaekwangia sp.]
MLSLQNLSIRTKLLLISLLPLLALVYLLQNKLQAEFGAKKITSRVYQEFEEVSRMSNLIHEIQIERGLVLTYHLSKSEDDRNKMIEQRVNTDKLINDVRSIYHQHKKNTPILNLLDSIHQLRDNLETYPEEANRVKSELLSEIHTIARYSQNADIKNQLEAHLYLLYTKEYLARIRSILMPSILSKEFKGREFARFAARNGQYTVNLNKFKETYSPELAAYFEKQFNSSSINLVQSNVDSLYNNPGFIAQMDKDLWWMNSSAAVNALNNTEKFSLERIKERAETELATINQSVLLSITFAVMLIISITLLVVLTVKQILTAIKQIKEAAERITQGDSDFLVTVDSTDEIGDLAKSFNQMIAVTKQYASAAETIGQGDYSPLVKIRSKSDTLGKALNNMKTNLQRLSDENKKRTWLLTGNSELNDSMRGDKDLANLTADIVNELASYLRAEIGTLYVRENGHLKFAGGYSVDATRVRPTIELGRGIIGQTALSSKSMIMNDVPEDYIRINSALGETKPNSLIVYPFLYENEVKGVIELGSFRPFSDLDLDLLNIVGNNIGIAITAAQSRDQMKQLLEETQRQAEELETQQEELRQFNEELQEKTELLQRSEEELKAQQEELQQTNEELEEKANILNDQKQALEFAKFQIEEKVNELEVISKYKTDFLANMSHELRTPLNSILILSQVMMENRNNTLSQKEIQFVKTIQHSGNDLLSLINEILDLSKIEAGKMEMDIGDFNVGEICKNIHTSFEEVARNKSIEFNIELDNKLNEFTVTSDQQRIEQIIKNFLANAFKFTERGGQVNLTITSASGDLIFRNKNLNKSQHVLAFTVSDTGIGIPKEKADVIFEAFQQVDGSTKRKYGGTGLGLSISRELALMLGGEIHLKSEPGIGSSFTLYLPAVTSASVEPHAQVNPPVLYTRPTRHITAIPEPDNNALGTISDDRESVSEADRKILIIEDDVDFSSALLEFVRERNYKGIIAHDGGSGLTYAVRYKPDAILLDMKLPGMGGGHVLRQLKSDSALRHIPVQIISGFDYRKEGLRQGALDFLKKPISREAFWKAIDNIENFVTRKPKKLLIIEDDQQHNLAVKELIGNGDVNCYSAFSGQEAFKMMETDSFDCIIIDMGLPDMSGFQFLESLKESKPFRKIPIIVYTGKNLSKEDNSKLEMLANTVVLKTAHSHERLLDEATLFLHRVESKLPKEKQKIIRKLHKTDEVLKGKKVLIADDDIRNVYSLVTVLEQEGVECITAENGKAAVEALQNDPAIDMVLMDVMMPEMDGYEASREIRKSTAFQHLPIIALTAKAMKGDREKCLEAGMSDYVSKPLNIQQLVSLMRVWLYA